MERKGSGFEKVLTAYPKQVNFTDELNPTYTSSSTWFKAVLPNLNYSIQGTSNIGVQKSSQKSNQKSDQKNSQKIVALIQSNPNVTIASMAESLLQVHKVFSDTLHEFSLQHLPD